MLVTVNLSTHELEALEALDGEVDGLIYDEYYRYDGNIDNRLFDATLVIDKICRMAREQERTER